MSWSWIAVAFAASVLFSLTVPKPKPGWSAARRRLVTAGRVVFLLVVLALFYRAFFHGL